MAMYDDPIGAFAAAQVGVLELSIYVTAAERPALAGALVTILEENLLDRSAASSVFEQLVVTERAIMRVWSLRLGRMAGGAT